MHHPYINRESLFHLTWAEIRPTTFLLTRLFDVGRDEESSVFDVRHALVDMACEKVDMSPLESTNGSTTTTTPKHGEFVTINFARTHVALLKRRAPTMDVASAVGSELGLPPMERVAVNANKKKPNLRAWLILHIADKFL